MNKKENGEFALVYAVPHRVVLPGNCAVLLRSE